MTDAQVSNVQLNAVVTGTPKALVSQVGTDVLITGSPTIQLTSYSVDVIVSWAPVTTSVYDHTGKPREVFRLTGSGLEPVFLAQRT